MTVFAISWTASMLLLRLSGSFLHSETNSQLNKYLAEYTEYVTIKHFMTTHVIRGPLSLPPISCSINGYLTSCEDGTFELFPGHHLDRQTFYETRSVADENRVPVI